MSMKLAPALIIGLLATAPSAHAQELAGTVRPDRFPAARLPFGPAFALAPQALAPGLVPAADLPTGTALTAPGALPAAPRLRTLALGAVGGAAAGAAIGCVIGDCGGDFLHPPDDALVGGLLGTVVGLIIALWVEPDDDRPSPRLPPRPR